MVFHPDTRVLGALLYQSVVTAAFGFLAWIHLLQHYGTVALHSFVFIMPIAGVALGGMVLKEPITWKILLALAFIVAGILIIHFKPEKRIMPITFYKG
jgi:drug/metabolite transporter (DMT)-like permease